VITQLFVASTAFGLATVAAAVADGLFDEPVERAGPPPRRVLVVTNNAEMPEAAAGLLEVSGATQLAQRFDAVYDYNELIEPQHPTSWRPREDDLPLWQRHFGDRWKLSDDVRLVVESIQTDPALALCRIFANARIDVYADGLMSYGPTRNPLPDSVGARVERLLHLDLVPGVAPLLLSDWQVPARLISTTAFREVIAELTSPSAEPAEQVVLVLGQYLAAADLLTEAEETALYAEMVVGGAATYGGRVVFKPHPCAPRTQHLALRRAAEAAGVDLRISADTELAECWFARGAVAVVIGCFSTALLTAASCYGLPVARIGTELMLDRLTPYQNSNRIPVTIVDALVPDLRSPQEAVRGEAVQLDELVTAVGYAMQPRRYANRRSAAADFLARYPTSRARYVKRQRLTRLRLPGGLPPRPIRSRVRRTLRRLHRMLA
jgi:hypothetical protein